MMKEAVLLGVVAPECVLEEVVPELSAAPVQSHMGRSRGLRVWRTVPLPLPRLDGMIKCGLSHHLQSQPPSLKVALLEKQIYFSKKMNSSALLVRSGL